MDTRNRKEALAHRYFFNRGRASDEYDQYWIRYKPMRVARKQLKSVRNRQIFVHVLLAVLLLAAAHYGIPNLLLVMLAFLLAASILRIHHLIFPTHVSLTEEGFQLHWLRSWFRAKSALIAWSRLSHVSLGRQSARQRKKKIARMIAASSLSEGGGSGSKPITGVDLFSKRPVSVAEIAQYGKMAGKKDLARLEQPGTPDTRVEFNVIARGIPFWQRMQFFLLAPKMSDGWLTSDRAKVILPLVGLASSDDRKRLQFAFQRFLPSYRIEPAVSDELNLAVKVESYTDIWLDALSATPKHLRTKSLAEGTRLAQGRYEIASVIGAGGQAIVYLAAMQTEGLFGYVPGRAPSKDDSMPVVLKEFVLPSQAGVNVRKRVLQNIQRESDLLKGLNHPNIVKLLDFFVEDQRAYLVLEQIRGVTLKEYVKLNGAVSEEEAINYALQMCTILNYLHDRKTPVIHRDFTPDNLMLAHGDIIKLIDFNVAQHLESSSTKNVVGKHSYIPPEQFRGEPTVQSDIYAMGATLYYLLTATEPEPISASFPKDKRLDLSEEMNQIVGKATALDSAYRYLSCDLLRAELEELRKTRYGI